MIANITTYSIRSMLSIKFDVLWNIKLGASGASIILLGREIWKKTTKLRDFEKSTPKKKHIFFGKKILSK